MHGGDFAHAWDGNECTFCACSKTYFRLLRVISLTDYNIYDMYDMGKYRMYYISLTVWWTHLGEAVACLEGKHYIHI